MLLRPARTQSSFRDAASSICGTGGHETGTADDLYAVPSLGDGGEGPSVDAHRLGMPVGDVDLADPGGLRWVAFAGPALALGAAAIFAFPLRVGGVRVGVLCLYERRPGLLTDDQHACAVVLADVVTQAILALQAQAPAGVADALGAVGDQRAEVHQAAGILAIRFDTSVGDALARLRAHAYGEGRPLADVARDVVAGRPFLE